jgi:hypothetical protein
MGYCGDGWRLIIWADDSLLAAQQRCGLALLLLLYVIVASLPYPSMLVVCITCMLHYVSITHYVYSITLLFSILDIMLSSIRRRPKFCDWLAFRLYLPL